jgi:hypothetical protein
VIVEIFSSPVATAIANAVFFIGILFATSRVLRSWWQGFKIRYQSRSLEMLRMTTVHDLKKLRAFSSDSRLLAAEIARSIVLEIKGYVAFVLCRVSYSAGADTPKISNPRNDCAGPNILGSISILHIDDSSNSHRALDVWIKLHDTRH